MVENLEGLYPIQEMGVSTTRENLRDHLKKKKGEYEKGGLRS